MNQRLVGFLLLLIATAVDAASINVNTAVDEFGTGSNCSLREAIQSANNNGNFGGCVASGSYGQDAITVPAGTFSLSRSAAFEDNNANGDLDIRGDLTLTGVSSGSTIIRSDPALANDDRDRLIHVISGTVELRNMTLRDGFVGGQGAGGGLRTEPGTSTTLILVVVGLNTAGGNAGGILNRGEMSLQRSTVSNNATLNALTGGGGVFVSAAASLTLIDSRILGNEARLDDDGIPGGDQGGGGIYVADGGALVIRNSAIEGNSVRRRLFQTVRPTGGGILSQGAQLDLENCTISDNFIEGDNLISHGGGIKATGPVSIRRCLITNNRVESNDVCSAGGVALDGSGASIVDSVISGNQACTDGGVFLRGARMLNSSVLNNVGGGVRSSNGAIVNSSVIGNSGGPGLRAEGSVTVASSTIAANSNPGGTGGVFVSAGDVLTILNSVIAGNSGSISDCSGVLQTSGNNTLIQTVAGSCTIVGSALTNVSAGLAPLANNGGPTVGASIATVFGVMSTRQPLPTSPLLDAGVATGCTDGTALLPTDQLGRPRSVDGPDPDTTARCDIGAVEFQDVLLVSGFE